MNKPLKTGIKRMVGLVLLLIVLTIANDAHIRSNTAARLYTDTDAIPKNKVGLLLGTSKYLDNGHSNLYYQYRIAAAVRLFASGKVSYLIVSGDNSTKHYNEPASMQADLIAAGIPAERIFLDYAGFRTLDSVLRAREIFGQQQFTCISQAFHNERAIYLGLRKGMDIVGYNAADVPTVYGVKVLIREYLARMKMQLDLLLGKQPKFLGERVLVE